MQNVYLHKIKYLQNVSNELFKSLKTLSKEQLEIKFNGVLFNKYSEDVTILTILSHIIGCRFYITSKLITSDKVLDEMYDAKSYFNKFQNIIEKGNKNELSLIELKTLSEDSLQLVTNIIIDANFKDSVWDDFSSKESAAVWIEQYSTHDNYHRGQISQEMSKIGEFDDFSRFHYYLFK